MKRNILILVSLGFILFSSFDYLKTKYHGTSADGLILPSVFRSGGMAAAASKDYTGSPLSGNKLCSSCHSGGAFQPSITVAIKDGSSNLVDTYIPGETYTIEYKVTTSSGTPAGYGFQSAILNSNNAQAGTLSAISANSQVSTIGAVKYPEQVDTSPSGIFTFSWIAPSAGTGDVKIFAVGLAVNGSNTGGDNSTAGFSKVLGENTSLANFDEQNQNLLSVFPNPSNGKFRVEMSNFSGNIEISVFDLSGKLKDLKNVSANSSTLDLDYSKIGKGVYFMKISDGNTNIVKKIVIN